MLCGAASKSCLAASAGPSGFGYRSAFSVTPASAAWNSTRSRAGGRNSGLEGVIYVIPKKRGIIYMTPLRPARESTTFKGSTGSPGNVQVHDFDLPAFRDVPGPGYGPGLPGKPPLAGRSDVPRLRPGRADHGPQGRLLPLQPVDRKSNRLNSSH